MFRRTLSQLLLIALLCAPAAAQQTPAPQPQPVIDEGGRVENPPESLSLAYKFKEGESNRYQVQIMNEGSYRLLNQKQTSTLKTVTELFFRQTTKSEEDGLFNVEWDLLSGAVRIPDYGESVISIPEMVYTMDERGAVKKIKGLEKLAILPGKPQQKMLADLLVGMRFQGFPKTQLKVGDEWTQDYPLSMSTTEKPAGKITSKLVGYNKCDGYDCAKIETKYDYPVEFELEDKTNGKLKLEGKESGSFVTQFAFKEGKMIRTEGDISVDATVKKEDGSGDAFLKLAMNTVSRLLPPPDAKKGEE